MIGVIADDLTGAAELGAVGLRHGLRAEILLNGVPSGDADLVCRDTDSRSCPPAQAAERAAHAARVFRQPPAGWLYKKTDSVLRGNVTPELEAIVAELGLDGALLVPANPSLGRTIVRGQYFVHGQRIHETEFARDPQHPRSSPNVCELLQAPAALPLLVRQAAEGLPRHGIVIGEAATADDLRRWAALRNDRWLMAGGAEFFAALSTAAAPLPQESRVQGRELFVCGSASDVTRTFVAAQARQGVPVFSLPDALVFADAQDDTEVSALAAGVASAFQLEPRAILHAGPPRILDASLSRMVARQLVRTAVSVLRRTRVAHVFAEGGSTAVGLARAMGWHRLAVKAELAPGVVSLSVVDGGPERFTIKPGSYRWPPGVTAG
jgi:uncharacterized protein YgbK (DUF1537 family)